jgi:hypothetical protein
MKKKTPKKTVDYFESFLACGCHPHGSIRKDCLQDTGQCSCHSYTTGHQCDKCIDSSLTLTEHGCVNCR